jgi:hypothetical protein
MYLQILLYDLQVATDITAVDFPKVTERLMRRKVSAGITVKTPGAIAQEVFTNIHVSLKFFPGHSPLASLICAVSQLELTGFLMRFQALISEHIHATVLFEFANDF